MLQHTSSSGSFVTLPQEGVGLYTFQNSDLKSATTLLKLGSAAKLCQISGLLVNSVKTLGLLLNSIKNSGLLSTRSFSQWMAPAFLQWTALAFLQWTAPPHPKFLSSKTPKTQRETKLLTAYPQSLEEISTQNGHSKKK